MSKTNSIKQFFHTKLTEQVNQVYYGNATDNAVLPYAVFKIRTSTIDFPTHYGNVEVNFFASEHDSTDIDTTIDNVESSLDMENFITKNINLFVYTGTRSNIENRTKGLMQIRLTFDINYIYYGGELNG